MENDLILDGEAWRERDQIATLAIVGAGALAGAVVSAGINGAGQLIRIAKGEQESFQAGSLLGSAVEGAIIGGASAIPGIGFVGTVLAGGAGAAANSAISQKIDEGTIDGWEVAEDGLVGAASAGVFYGISQIGKAFKGSNTPSIKEQYNLTAKELEKNIIKMQAIKEAGKTASSLTRKTQQFLKSEIGLLIKKYVFEELKEGLVEGITSSILNVVGVKTAETMFEELLSIILPIYKDDDEETIIEYIKEYFGDIYDGLTAECDS